MKLSHKIAGALVLLIGQAILAYLTFHSFAKAAAEPCLFLSLINAVPILYVPLIIIGWQLVGGLFGFVLLVLSSLVAFAAFAFCERPLFLVHIFLYALTGYASWLFSKKLRGLFEENKTKLEETQAALNTLKVQCEREKVLSDALQKRYGRYDALKGVTETLGTFLSIEEVTKYAVQRASSIVNKCDAAMLYLLDEQSGELALKSSYTSAPSIKIKSKLGDIFDNWVLKKHTPLIVDDVRKDFRFNLDGIPQGEHPYASLIAAPLLTEKRTLGVLRLDSHNPAAFTPDDLRLLSILADLSAAAIKNCMLYIKTQELAIRDSLTGLFVHRYFKSRLSEELARSAKDGVSLSVILLDIDHFKDYNDKFGHAAGDAVLRAVARILKENSGPGELAARYGGEEFALILPGYSNSKALRLAQKIRATIASTPIALRRKETRITVSLGVTAFPVDSLQEDELLRIADARLYKAKEAGRNKVCGA